MPKSVRPWLTAAVAIVGVGAVSVAPLEPAAKSDVRVENAAVLVEKAPSPFEYYPQVLQRSASNADDLVREYLADPLPIVRAIADNQNRALADVVDAAAALDPGAFVRAVVAAISQPVTGVVKVVGSGEPFETASSMLVRLALPVVSGVLAAGAAMTDVVKAFADLDLVNAVSGLLNVPARIADGLLNGRVDGQHDEYFGLLGKMVEAPVSEQISGPVDYLIHSLQGIGDTISSSAPASPTPVAGPAVVPDLGSPTVTVTAPAADREPADPEPATPDDDRPAAPASGRPHADENLPAASDDADAPAPSTSGDDGEAASGASADDQTAGVERSQGDTGPSTSSAAPSARGDDSDAPSA
ncbi:hypothetical protein BST22_17835 [Mycolicibacterium chubuense]|uniref:Uncharacterized protein n=1 Tax=Mycolicibacterium chubuense TaxID=1800 RepID=A0A0J6WMS5_MYCCU|nr:hypothetical protein [Mycolicibacterium chubuense]KMO84680.1 hypothetical protein MCHUDSM44219_00303 [Mycolicibacterium chubuense]ORA48941.1 hypothetical protein BST22_17835 [Mycolicibacterium chubuense]SPY00742.1 Uncharacterised protein [Mycolicibacterium chubuense]